MSCKLTMRLVSESQEGNIGVDWRYQLEVKVFHGALAGEATVEVAKHKLQSGEVSLPHGSPDPVVLFEGECEDELLIRLNLTAAEVDTFIDDVGKASKDIRLEMPAPGARHLVREVDIEAGVRESPSIRNLNAIFTLRLRFVVEKTA